MNLLWRQLKFTIELIAYSILNNINENYKEFRA